MAQPSALAPDLAAPTAAALEAEDAPRLESRRRAMVLGALVVLAIVLGTLLRCRFSPDSNNRG